MKSVLFSFSLGTTQQAQDGDFFFSGAFVRMLRIYVLENLLPTLESVGPKGKGKGG